MNGPGHSVGVRLLGRFEVTVDGRAVTAAAWGHRRAEDLVKLLALSPGHRLTRDEVVEALWPRLSATAGVANLHKAAHHARRALGWPEAVVLRRGVVELAPGNRVETDVERLEAGGGGDVDAAELLPDDRYEEWTLAHRERLGALRRGTLRRQGRWAELLRVDPADEEAGRVVMRDHAAAGDRRAAARAFVHLREALAAIGLTPSDETVSLFREISRGDAVRAPRRPSGPMVGRSRERAAAVGALDATTTGHGRALVLLGDAGIGKTRLVDALLEVAEARDLHTFRGAAHDDEGGRAYGPVLDALDPLVTARPDLLEALPRPVRRVLALLVPAARDAADPHPVARATRHQVFAAVAQLLRSAAGERGAVLALEDLHAADPSTLALAHYLARAARLGPVLLVLTSRHAEAGPELARMRAALAEQRAATEIVLRPLGRSSLAQLAQRAAGRPLAPETIDAIATAAAGNPFFAEELAAGVDDRGAVRVPEHVHAVLDARLDRLPEDLRIVVRVAGVLGEPFPVTDLAAIAGVDRVRAAAAIAAAVRAGILEEGSAGARFRHPLLRDAARRPFDPARLAEVHLRAARRGTETGAAPERVAHHLLRAGRAGEAVPLLTAAARRAASVGAYADGRRWAEEALTHAPEAERWQLLELLADLRHASGDRRAASTYAAAADLAPPELSAEFAIKRAHALTAAGAPAEAARILRHADATSPAQRARLAIARGIASWYAGDIAGARAQADVAASLVDGPRDGQAELADLRALIAHTAGTWERHAGWQFAEVWHVPELAGRVFDAYLCVTEYVLHSDDPRARMAEFARHLREHARRAGARRGEAFGATLLGEIALMTGDAHGARPHLLEAAVISREVGSVGGEAVARLRLGEALSDLGDGPAAQAEVQEALALAQASSLAVHLVLPAHAPLVRMAGGPDAALAVVDAADALLRDEPRCRFCPVDYQVAAATACAEAGEVTRARAFLERIEEVTALWNGGPWMPAAAEARGAVLRAEGDAEGAARALRRAVAGYAAAGQLRSEARVRRALAERIGPGR